MTHIDRIAALLAKAERTDNPAEAEAYLAKAQMLATQSSIDLALARARTARREAREQPMSRTIAIGEPGKRANTHLVSLFITVGQCNDLQIDIARNSTYVIAYGMPTDIDLVETLFGSLATQMAAGAATWLAAGVWRTDSYISREGYRRAHTAQTARAAFYRGFIERIGVRLAEAREQVIAAARADDTTARAGAGDEPHARERTEIVLRDKTAEVRTFYRSSSQARGSWGGYSGAVSRRGGAATSAGATAAAAARLGTVRAVGRRSGAISDGG
jgi:hypothetical protein